MATKKPTRKKRVATKTKKSVYTSSKSSPLSSLRKNLTIAVVIAMVLFGLIGLAYSLIKANAAVCTVSENLVNSCRPWLGATVGHYPGVGSSAFDLKSQVLDHERRVGRQMDIVHSYSAGGSPPLDSTDLYFHNRPNTYAFVTYKPQSGNWAAAGGGNATVNANIDKMANSIKAAGPKKVMLSIYHEPENDMAGTVPGCSKDYGGGAGTPAEYRAMWRNVYNRFNAKNVTNVVWVVNFMGFSEHDCMIDDLWPGNDIVDWVMWDPYSVTASWNAMIGRFYNWMMANSNAQHDYKSKAWGIAEWGAWKETTRASTYALYDGARAALAANTFPKVKAYVAFDYGIVSRVAYDRDGVYDPTEMAKYKQFAQDPHFTNAFYGGAGPSPTPPPPAPTPPPPPPATTPDTTPPTVSLTAPTNGATLSNTITMAGSASDNRGVKTISFVVDGAWVASDTTAPYSISLDTNRFSVGSHTLRLRAWDDAGNYKDSNTITVTMKKDGISTGGGGSPVIAPSNPSDPSKPIVITPSAIRSLPSNKPIPFKGTLRIASASPSKPATVKLDNKVVTNNTIDSTQLTDGEHVIEVTEDGKTKQITVSVDNPLPTQMVNEVKAHPVAYAAGGGASLLALAGFLIRTQLGFMFKP